MSRTEARRGLVLVAVLLVVLLLVVDLLRADSFILGTWGEVQPGGTPLQRFVRSVTGRR